MAARQDILQQMLTSLQAYGTKILFSNQLVESNFQGCEWQHN